ncbi:hypothetical protein CBS101457_000899 [Exobasidium rhododendri]|nr:hypothetical protein CBS101457_000899 [Exobasidium rhododendri]
MSGYESYFGQHDTSGERSRLLSSSHRQENYNSNNDNSNATPPSQNEEEEQPFTGVPVLLCVAVWVPVFIASLDSTIVATLVASVSASFNKSEQASWLGTSYLLSVCCFTPIYGRLCDVMGRKYAMLLALTSFSIGTFLCGVAPSMNSLIAARALAGIGGGGLATCTSTIFSDVIPLRNRGLYQGLTNIIYGLGSGLGGPVGGFLNDTWGWRNAFLVQIPFLAASIVLCTLYVHVQPANYHPVTKADGTAPTKMDKVKSIDFLGSLTLVSCVGPILLSISFMSANDKTIKDALVWVGLLVGSLSGVVFVLVEKYVAKAPILPLRVVTQRTGGSVAAANLFLSITTFTILYNYPLYFQAVRLTSSSQAGLHLIPNSAALSIASVLAGLYMKQTGLYYRYNFVNSLLMVASTAWMISLMPSTPDWVTYIAIIPSGFGISGVLTCTLLALINSVPRSDIAVATGMSYLFRTTGQVIGVSSSGALLQFILKKELHKRIKDESLISAIRHQSSIIRTLPDDIQQAAIESYSVALRFVFILALCSAIATSVSCFFMEDRRLPDAKKSSVTSAPQDSDAEEGE